MMKEKWKTVQETNADELQLLNEEEIHKLTSDHHNAKQLFIKVEDLRWWLDDATFAIGEENRLMEKRKKID